MNASIKWPERLAREDSPCAACHSEDDVRWADDLSVGFCGECREQALTHVAYSELGGEG